MKPDRMVVSPPSFMVGGGGGGSGGIDKAGPLSGTPEPMAVAVPVVPVPSPPEQQQHCRNHSHRKNRNGYQRRHRQSETKSIATAGNMCTPHVATLRMNPYVRCVRMENAVPEIRSLKELLSLTCYADSADSDTPCLRLHTVWGAGATPVLPNSTMTNAAAAGVPAARQNSIRGVHDARNAPLADHGTVVALDAGSAAPVSRTQYDESALNERDRLAREAADVTSGANMHPSMEPSPLLTFTVDSVTTPNTFATALQHQRLVMAAAGGATDSSPGCNADNADLMGPGDTCRCPDRNDNGNSGESGGDAAATGAEAGRRMAIPAEECEAALMQLPRSTVEVEAATEMQQYQLMLNSSQSSSAGTGGSTRPGARLSNRGSSMHGSRSRSGRAELITNCGGAAARGVDNSSSDNRSADGRQYSAEVPAADAHETGINGHIVSPRSLGLPCTVAGMCTSGGRGASAQHRPHTLPQQQEQEKQQLQHHDHNKRHPHPLQQHLHSRQVPPRSVVVPAAKIEESPYHYITRNFVGGTFLYYSSVESKQYFLSMCYRVIEQVKPILERETMRPDKGLFPTLSAPACVLGDIHGNFADLSYFLRQIITFHDFNLTAANLLCLGDYVDRGPFSLECVMLLFSLKIMNADKLVLLRGNHEDRVVCGDLQTYGLSCFAAQCQTVFGYVTGMQLFRAVTALFRYLPLACELVVPHAPNRYPSLSESVSRCQGRHGCGGRCSAPTDASTRPSMPKGSTSVATVRSGGDRASASDATRVPPSQPRARPSSSMSGGRCCNTVHENLYVRQVCVPIQLTTPPQPLRVEASATPSGIMTPTAAAAVPVAPRAIESSSSQEEYLTPSSLSTRSLERRDGDCSSVSSSASLSASHGAVDSGTNQHKGEHYPQQRPKQQRRQNQQRVGRPGGGRPLYPRTHEERILCTHGGIPRFFGPPLDEDSLSFLRQTQFPRLLTVFPGHASARGDPECAPDYYHRCLLPTLRQRYLPVPMCGCKCDACATAAWDNDEGIDDASTSVEEEVSSEYDSMSTSSCYDGGCSSERHAQPPTAEPCQTVFHQPQLPSQPEQRYHQHQRHHDPSRFSCGTRSEAHGGCGYHCGCTPTPPLPKSPESDGGGAGDDSWTGSAARAAAVEEMVRRGWYVAFDLMWSDPTPTEPILDSNATSTCATAGGGSSPPPPDALVCCDTNEWGFGVNARGRHVISYSAKAVEAFLDAYQYVMLMRAHQEKAHGLRWGTNRRVLTVFSSSDYLGHGNGAGCVMVSVDGEVQLIEKLSDRRC